MENFKIEIDSDGIALITFDAPGKSMNTLSIKAIDEIGDPDHGKKGYPLQASCQRVIRMAWPGLPIDVADGHISILRAQVSRYPARRSQ